jgi:DNA-nicking Smr family endonuclease
MSSGRTGRASKSGSMAKKQKRSGGGKAGGTEPQEGSVLPRAPERLSSPFKDVLGPMKKQLEDAANKAEQARREAQRNPPPPPPPPRPISRKTQRQLDDDGVALSLAMQGVKPLAGDRPGRVAATTPKVPTRTARVAPFGRSAEDEARARLDALVAQDVSFRIERDHDWIRAARTDAPPRVTRELARRTRASETLDLHGMNQRESRDAVIAFVRQSHKRGLSVLCVVHGKGQHSEDGQGVLRDVVVRALTDSPVTTLVLAFVSAPDALGGSGALLVELKH